MINWLSFLVSLDLKAHLLKTDVTWTLLARTPNAGILQRRVRIGPSLQNSRGSLEKLVAPNKFKT
jgi:hypothetical protein